MFLGNSSGDYTLAYNVLPNSFVFQQSVVFPEVILEKYESLQCRCFVGMFPEIERAWISIDQHLYLWNYEKQNDFFPFDGFDQVISAVGLVKPRSGVFSHAVDYIMIVVTPLEASILGVKFDKKTSVVEILTTPLVAQIDNVVFNKVIGSADGRVFLSGEHEDVFELLYYSQPGWFSKQCKLVNLTQSFITYLVPTFIPFIGANNGKLYSGW